MEKRKKEHIELALSSQSSELEHDDRFNYEPLFNAHPKKDVLSIDFLGKTMRNPIWISSMTGGTDYAKIINTNLAKACNEFGLGMGLGSCRTLLESDKYLSHYDLRDVVGSENPFYANIGIAQVEKELKNGSEQSLVNLVEKLRADGLIIHINPIQEWLQPEGDDILNPPIETIHTFLEKTDLKVIVKEVGQGFGPKSLMGLLKLPLEAVEFAAYGGTNFSKVELERSLPVVKKMFGTFSQVGNNAFEMLNSVNDIVENENDILCKQLIISGGIRSFLDGYYLINKSNLPAIYGQASAMLKYAREDYGKLREYIQYQIKGLQMAYTYLTLKDE